MKNIPQAFTDYFVSVYGDRWPALLESLLSRRETSKVAIGSREELTENVAFQLGGLSCAAQSKGNHYELDLASVWAAAAPGWKTPGRVLDLCSAPGGKALSLQWIWEGKGDWSLNELSQPRLSRLKSVMRQFSPCPQESLHFFKRDASRWGLGEKDAYDYVICDVPCSGEEHLLSHSQEISRWSKKGSERLAIRQHAILCAALEAVRSEGEILYSTCSINPLENDGVIEKFLKKRGDRVQVRALASDLPLEPTHYGYNIFPDRTSFGPIYLCVLKKSTS